jgi:hypothetical protein
MFLNKPYHLSLFITNACVIISVQASLGRHAGASGVHNILFSGLFNTAARSFEFLIPI